MRAGSCSADGTEGHFSGPQDAQRAGIGVVHQERNLIPAFSVAENIALPNVPKRFGFVDKAAVRDIATRCLSQLDVQLDVDAQVGTLSVAQLQLVEIAESARRRQQRPAPRRADRLPDLRRGRPPLHRRATAARRRQGDRAGQPQTRRGLRRRRHGDRAARRSQRRPGARAVRLHPRTDRRSDGRPRPARRRTEQAPGRCDGATRLELSDVATELGHQDISLAVRPGEILGMYGLVGAGRSELARAVLGLDRITYGTVAVHGEPVRIGSVREALQPVPDRLRHREPKGRRRLPRTADHPQHRGHRMAAPGPHRHDPAT